MPPLSHSASRQYAGYVNLQQPRVQANFDQQQQLEMMQYLQLVQHQQMQGSFQFPSTPHTMGTSLGTTQRPDEITTFTDVRMAGQAPPTDCGFRRQCAQTFTSTSAQLIVDSETDHG